MDLNLFYSVFATATATLLGLLFIAIQPNIDRLINDPQGHWKALAVSTFQTYGLLLVVSMFAFIPLLRSVVLSVTSLLGIWRQLTTWLPVWRQTAKERSERLRETFWMLVGPAAMYAWLIFSSYQLNQGKGSESAETNIAAALIILLVIVLRNSWRLLFEIPTEEQQRSKSS